MQIRYNLYKLENALTFQVSAQSEAVTEYLRSIGRFVAKNGWKIRSRNYPGIDITTSTIYVRGFNCMLDTRPARIFALDNDYRDELVDEIYQALKELVPAAISESNQIQYHSLSASTTNDHVETIVL
jgi:hypothetical protein